MSPLKIIFLLSLVIFSSNCSEESSFLDFLKKFAQNYIDNDLLIMSIEIIRRRNKHNFPDNFAKNKAAFKNHEFAIRHNKGFIEDQHNYNDMSYGIQTLSVAFKNHEFAIKHNKGFIEDQHNYKDMSYGIQPLSKNGCGLIATYNVLYHLTKQENIDFPSIIKYLENDGIILRGLFGTSMKAVDDYFKKHGFRTWSSANKKEQNWKRN